MDNLEQFIRSEKEALDSKAPREKLWDRIESDLDNKNQWTWLWRAAVLVLIPVCGFLLWERNQTNVLADTQFEDSHLGPEFEETEMYYTQMISETQSLIESFNTADPQVNQAFSRDLASLDSMYLELKTEYIETSNASVVDAMIYNLQLRMELLNQQLMILEEIENQHHEKNTVNS